MANGWSTARVYMPDELKARIEKLVNDYNTTTGGGRMGNEAAQGGGGDGGQGMSSAAAQDALAAAAAMYGIDPTQLVNLDAASAALLLGHHQQQVAQAGLSQVGIMRPLLFRVIVCLAESVFTLHAGRHVRHRDGPRGDRGCCERDDGGRRPRHGRAC